MKRRELIEELISLAGGTKEAQKALSTERNLYYEETAHLPMQTDSVELLIFARAIQRLKIR
jgi:hypothetical protein